MPQPRLSTSSMTLSHVLKIFVSLQAVHLLRVSAELEGRANALRKEALQCLTVALCGSDTRKFWELLTAFFGANHKGDEEDSWDFIDPAPEIPRPLPLTKTDSEDEKKKVETPASKPIGSVWHKPSLPVKKDELPNLCDPQKAICMYPATKGTLNETGIPADLQVSREQAMTHAGGSVYLCRHKVCQQTPFMGSSPAALYSHVHRKHLGIVLACPYCQHKIFWNSRGWKSHMSSHHRGAPHYRVALADESSMAAEMIASMQKSEKQGSETSSSTRGGLVRKRRSGSKRVISSSSSSSSSQDSSSDSTSSSDTT